MTRRLLPLALFALLTCALQATPLTIYFTGTCSDCVGTGAGGTVNASITFASNYYYDIYGAAESNNLAYGDVSNGSFTGIDFTTSSITSFIYNGSNIQPQISTSSPYFLSLNFGWGGTGTGFPNAKSATIEWGNPTGTSYDFNTIGSATSAYGDWSFSRTTNTGPCTNRCSEDQGTNGVWSFTAPPPAPVPEPATWAEMAGGLGLLGFLGLAGKLR